MTNSNLLNREIYQIDPSTRKLVNEGVASVNDEKTDSALAVLRYELETFVCDGQYERGLNDILSIYLSQLNSVQQPGVWISGFYGSGKSHLVKMLRALWIDTVFPDGATARGIANLPQEIRHNLIELTNRSKRYGGLHAVSGTLGSGARGSVRLALLRLIFKSVGLPEQYPNARFVMWLKSEGIYDQVIALINKKGLNWEEEFDQFYVSTEIHEALALKKPLIFPDSSNFLEILTNLYPPVTDISSDEMVKAIKSALIKDDKFPLTLVVLDEVQQFIGEDSDRSNEVREVVEACCKNIGEKLLFIGTGQTAITGTSNLKKHEGRFTVRIELSDADVETVVRKVILAKRADAVESIEQVLNTNIGEISRQLIGTGIAHKNEDIKYFALDYPILPVRRRFWESTLRVLDQTGTDSQLRNQLSMVHKVIQTNLDKPIGHVVPADYLFFDLAEKMLQSKILPKQIYENTITWYNGSEDERLTARACGLVFLINKLGSYNTNIGIKATPDTIADLMVEDLREGSSDLRKKIPDILKNCELLMKVGDEYRIQTKEAEEWYREFARQRGIITNEKHRLDQEREDRIKKLFAEKVGKVSLNHGESKQPREAYFNFDTDLPSDSDRLIVEKYGLFNF